MKNITRTIQRDLQRVHRMSRGRLVVLTGARQCGKSTLAGMAFPDYPVVNLDSPVEREVYERLAPADWIERLPQAIVDEAQKLPEVFGTIKACYDRADHVRYVILGSSQVLLLKRVRESLAGRVAIRELFPFSLPELCLTDDNAESCESRLIQLLRSESPAKQVSALFSAQTGLSGSDARTRMRWDYFLHWGGMPALLDKEWTDEDRFEWLQDYYVTYLQRDLSDLARLDRLEPFTRAQKAAALRTAQLINYSELARLSDITAPTAKQFMRYLELSYQVILLPAWFRNQEKRLVKQPKLHFLDPGIRRAVLRKRGALDGAEFESAVAAEVYKQYRTARLPLECYHLRTVDGREVDLLLEREDGFVAIECKQTSNVSRTDFRHFRELQNILDKPVLACLIIAAGGVVFIPHLEFFSVAGVGIWLAL